jgi:hypothetical protein
MTRYNSEALAHFPWIASCDTLKAEDLLPKFWQVAEMVAVLADRPQLLNAETLASLTKLVGEDSTESDWDDEEASATLEELSLALDDAAPAGFYFGASEGDGAAFGFWLDEDWAEVMRTLGMEDEDPAAWASLIAELDSDGIDPGNFDDAYCGQVEGWNEDQAGADYAQQLADELGLPDNLNGTGAWPMSCIDWAQAWRELQMGDGYRLHQLNGGDGLSWLVFRAV